MKRSAEHVDADAFRGIRSAGTDHADTDPEQCGKSQGAEAVGRNTFTIHRTIHLLQQSTRDAAIIDLFKQYTTMVDEEEQSWTAAEA